MGAASDEIRVCPNHKSKEKVPLTSTFAFNGSEYWCPGCGYNHGLLGAGDIVKRTKEIDDREEYWYKLGKKYLVAKSTQVCDSLIYKGKRVSPKDLPKKEKKRIQLVIDNWKYKF